MMQRNSLENVLGVQRRQPHTVDGHPVRAVARPLAEIQRLLPGADLVLVLQPLRLRGPRQVGQVPVMREDAGGVERQVRCRHPGRVAPGEGRRQRRHRRDALDRRHVGRRHRVDVPVAVVVVVVVEQAPRRRRCERWRYLVVTVAVRRIRVRMAGTLRENLPQKGYYYQTQQSLSRHFSRLEWTDNLYCFSESFRADSEFSRRSCGLFATLCTKYLMRDRATNVHKLEGGSGNCSKNF
jgi:hypothetical protein